MAQRRQNNRKWLIGGLILVLLVSGVVGVVVWNNSQSTEDASQNKDKNDGENESGDLPDEVQAKIDKINEREKADAAGYEPTLTGSVTHQEIKGDHLILRVMIDQAIEEEGACKLLINLDGEEKYSGIVLMEANSNYYSCGFNIPLNSYVKGKYVFEVRMQTETQDGKLNGEFVYE